MLLNVQWVQLVNKEYLKNFILITGASKGLGRDLGKIFRENGYEVICLSRSKPDYDCIFIETDLTKESDIDKAYDSIKDYNIQLIINNAALFPDDSIRNFDINTSVDSLLVNTVGPIYLISKLLPTIIKNKTDIFNISGICQLDPETEKTSYSISKRALSSFSEILKEELQDTFSRVSNIILPGMNNKVKDKFAISTKDMASIIYQLFHLPKIINIDSIELSTNIPQKLMSKEVF